jgi:hypothetical protein
MSEAMDLDPNTIVTESSIDPTARNPNMISPQAVMAVAIIAILAWLAIAGWILLDNPSEGERAAILKQAEAVSFMAFGFFLGSSASSRNKDHQ